ncbi:MAG TPA: pilus assembly protein N-terminal domain-containing protein [Rhizomicrobium sp.]|nr:pilus assembly protein N-terminal domain-containing protein [Rhizomicrobium sp.]
MRCALLAALLAATCFTGTAVAASKEDVRKKEEARKNDYVALGLDEVHTLTFRGPVSTVYVGNPAIADVTMIDARHAFIQGKGYGRTNVMALNRDNVMVFNTHITVTGTDSGGTVTLNRGAHRVTLSCAGGRCEPTATPGDAKDSYDSVNNQVSTHQTVARTLAASEVKN